MRFIAENPRLRSLFLALVTPLIIGLGGLGYQVLWEPAEALGSSAPALSLNVARSGSDFRLKWNRDPVMMAHVETGVLRIRDGDHQQEFHLDADELRTGSVLYTPASNRVQFHLEISGAGQKRASESILALSDSVPQQPVAAAENPPATTEQQRTPGVYAVQVGAFHDRANAGRLLRHMEARYGASRLESSRTDPVLWLVLVGHEMTAEAAGMLAERIRSDPGLAQGHAFVIAERVNTPRL